MATTARPPTPATNDDPAYQAYLVLPAGFVVAPILFGLDKVTNLLLTDWTQDPAAEPLLDTPRRVAASYAELLTPAPVTRTTFPNDEGYAELVLTRAIPFASRGRRLRPDLGPARPGPERSTFAAGVLALTGISR
jgi:hypothetical protein